MKFIYDNKEIDTTKVNEKELEIECLKAQEWQFKTGYKNYEDAKKKLVENKAEKKNIDNRLLQEYEGKRAFEESIDYLIECAR